MSPGITFTLTEKLVEYQLYYNHYLQSIFIISETNDKDELQQCILIDCILHISFYF